MKFTGAYPSGTHQILVETELASGAYTAPPTEKLFLDISGNPMTVTTSGGVVIAAGDGGAVHITDNSAAGTSNILVGGDGQDVLKDNRANDRL